MKMQMKMMLSTEEYKDRYVLPDLRMVLAILLVGIVLLVPFKAKSQDLRLFGKKTSSGINPVVLTMKGDVNLIVGDGSLYVTRGCSLRASGVVDVSDSVVMYGHMAMGSGSNAAELRLGGNFHNHGVRKALNYSNTSSKVHFKGRTKQTLKGNTEFKNITVANPSGVELEEDIHLSGTLTLDSGHLELGAYDLLVDSGSFVGGSADSYIRINGSGKVVIEGQNQDSLFIPVGRNPYLPVLITGGGDADFTVGVSDKVYENPETQNTEVTTHVITETWTIQASKAVSDVTVEVGWDAVQEGTSFSRTQCQLAYWESGVSNDWNDTALTSSTGSDPYYQRRTLNMSTNQYFFGVGGIYSALPVNLIAFEGQWLEKNQVALLEWSTAFEENNSHFELERSEDGQNWTRIGSVEGAGNSLETQHYEFTDKLEGISVNASKLYYRLRQVDYDGAFEYSPVVVLSKSTIAPELTLYPNPSTSYAVVGNLNTEDLQHVEIYAMDGHLVKTYSTYLLDLSTISPGQYVVLIHTNSSVEQKKLIVIR